MIIGTFLFLLGAVAGFLVKRNNPGLGEEQVALLEGELDKLIAEAEGAAKAKLVALKDYLKK